MTYAQNIASAFHGSAHRIDRAGYGYTRALTDAELMKTAPAIFAEDKHESRSTRYAFTSTLDLLAGMRAEGFFPVKVQQAKSRMEGQQAHGKHIIRFRREQDMAAQEAREVVLLNSHNGASSFQLMAGVFRLVCANGLVVGKTDNEIRVRHSGDAMANVIEGAYSIVNDFDSVSASIENMKSVQLKPEFQKAFATAALALRYEDPEECGLQAEQLLRVRRIEDKAADTFTVFNVVQENMIKGGLAARKVDENGYIHRAKTREVKGIDQNIALNRSLWVLAEEMRKLAA